MLKHGLSWYLVWRAPFTILEARFMSTLHATLHAFSTLCEAIGRIALTTSEWRPVLHGYAMEAGGLRC